MPNLLGTIQVLYSIEAHVCMWAEPGKCIAFALSSSWLSKVCSNYLTQTQIYFYLYRYLNLVFYKFYYQKVGKCMWIQIPLKVLGYKLVNMYEYLNDKTK